MDNLIYVAFVLGGVGLFVGFIWFARRFNVTRSDAQVAQKTFQLIMYMFDEMGIEVDNKETVKKALNFVDSAIELFLQTYDVENLLDSQDLIYNFAREVAIENGVEVDDEFAELLNSVVFMYAEIVYNEKRG